MDKPHVLELIRGSELAEHFDLIAESLLPSARIQVHECPKEADREVSRFGGPRRHALENRAADWQLLIQIDSDEKRIGWMWGDTGRIYFWTRRQDISSANFERSWAILQCY